MYEQNIFDLRNTFSKYCDLMTWKTIFSKDKIEIFHNNYYWGFYELLKEPFCSKCSSPGIKTEDCYLQDFVYGFNKVYSIGVFSKKRDPYPQLCTDIRYLKDYGNKTRAIPLGYALDCLVQNLYPHLLDADYIVPVPIHKEKLEVRGFNQVELIMNHFCSRNNMKSMLCLNQVKKFELRPLSLEDRYQAVKDAFTFKFEFIDDINDAYVILLDDVVTSCATVSECSKVLMSSGALNVDVLACGRNELNGNN